MTFSKDKFKGLVHYICWKCSDPAKLGAIKLNKILWFADMMAFASLGDTTTGADYVRRKLGPVPKPILPVLRELAEEQLIRIEDVSYYNRMKKQFVSLREPDRSLFNARQLEIIDEVVQAICDRHTASSISERTHDDIWKLAEDGEEIPPYTIFASQPGTVTDKDRAWATERLRGARNKAAWCSLSLKRVSSNSNRVMARLVRAMTLAAGHGRHWGGVPSLSSR